jgi:hypothetical protein
MSRAAVINFFNMMAEKGFLAYREVTAKGGRKRLYRTSPEAPDEGSFRRVLADRIIDKARTKMQESFLRAIYNQRNGHISEQDNDLPRP